MVITVEIYKQIRRMRLDGMSQRQIAAVLRISRNTVKKYWDGDSVPWERKDYSREASVLTEDVIAFVRQCLDEDAHNPRKQHHTAKRIYDRLVAECGFTGGETTVRRLVRELREKPQEAFVPLAFPAGDAMQIDWGEATVYLNGVKTTVNLFCARLCYSGAPMVLAYRRQNEESFLEANVHALEYFGGVPRHVIFDNAKVAVKDGFGAHAKKQAGYSALSAHYGFDAVFCNPASGNEKGLVEGLVGYIRRNTCVPVPRVNSMDELNAMLEAKGTAPVANSARLADLVRRPQITYADIAPFDLKRPELPESVTEEVEIQIKYAGYLARQEKQVEEFKKEESRRLPEDINYRSIVGLRLEAQEKLSEIRPMSIGQAGRISGVSPADIAVLLIWLEQQKR